MTCIIKRLYFVLATLWFIVWAWSATTLVKPTTPGEYASYDRATNEVFGFAIAPILIGPVLWRVGRWVVSGG